MPITGRPRGRASASSRWLALIAVLLLGGCSTTGWFYRNADWLIERYAVKSVDANQAQLEFWRPGLERVLQQHLELEIPLLESYLELIARVVDGSPGKRVHAACLVSGANLIFMRHASLAADLAAPLMAALEPHQIDHFEGYMTERRARFRERYLTGNERERYRARVERLTERIERWTGSLEQPQQERVERLVASLPDIAENWMFQRKHREQRLLQLLRDGADRDRLHAQLLNWWVPWNGDNQEFTDEWKQAETAFIHLLDDLAVSLSDRQQQHFSGKVSSLRRDLAAMRGDTPQPVREIPRKLQCRTQQL